MNQQFDYVPSVQEPVRYIKASLEASPSRLRMILKHKPKKSVNFLSQNPYLKHRTFDKGEQSQVLHKSYKSSERSQKGTPKPSVGVKSLKLLNLANNSVTQINETLSLTDRTENICRSPREISIIENAHKLPSHNSAGIESGSYMFPGGPKLYDHLASKFSNQSHIREDLRRIKEDHLKHNLRVREQNQREKMESKDTSLAETYDLMCFAPRSLLKERFERR